MSAPTVPPQRKTPPTPPSPSKAAPIQPSGHASAFGRERIAAPPPRIVLNAVEGWGKTTCGSYTKNPALLMASGETGYMTLLEHGLVPDIDRTATVSWTDTLATLDEMVADGDSHSTLVLDALNGFERQCKDFVCASHFDGDWGERGYAGYAKGPELSSIEWVKLLARLDAVRARCVATILFLSHCKVRPFRNPEGPDYDRYSSDVHEKIWDATKQWADAVFFGNFLVATIETDPKKKTKAVGDDTRILHTTRSASYDAKNRFGMSGIITLPNDPSASWATIEHAINERKSNNG